MKPELLHLLSRSTKVNWQEFALPWLLICACLALVAFYASSLTHQLLQALGAAIGIIVVGLFVGYWFAGSFSRGQQAFSSFGAILCRGPLVLIVGASVTIWFAAVLTWRRLRWLWMTFLALIAL